MKLSRIQQSRCSSIVENRSAVESYSNSPEF